ncbi:PASTA domain-containing protein [Brachybacterium sp. GCM10030267]|uniref:PASTA domain-containing protein n=1 Tax=Brachybacterium sp. GCM10030267 TaxID=3273381 RepID=UPI003623B1A1
MPASRTSTAPSWRRPSWSSVRCASQHWTWPARMRPMPPAGRTASRRRSPRSSTATARPCRSPGPNATRRSEDPRATGKGKIIEGHPAGGKTGTSGSQFHTWYVGFTRQMSTAVWFGHPQANVRPAGFPVDGEMLRSGKVWGNTVSLPTWQEYMSRVHEGLPSEPFPSAPASTKQPGTQAVQKGVVPDVSGMVLSEAQSTLEAAGYRVEITKEPSGTVGEWFVIGTEQPPGTRLPEGETVVVRQSTGQG